MNDKFWSANSTPTAFAEYDHYLCDLIWCITGVEGFSPWPRTKNTFERIKFSARGVRLKDWDIEELAAWLLESRHGWGDRQDVAARVFSLPARIPVELAEMAGEDRERVLGPPLGTGEGLTSRRERIRRDGDTA
jgi:hypothetical protein